MAKEVKIPVQVTGAEEAQRDLQQTGQAVKGVGSAGAQAAKGTGQATAATKQHAAAHAKAAPAVKKTAQATNQFDDSAKTALTGILGQFNPMLASLGNIAVDVAKGIGKMTFALGGMLAIGVVISGLVALFRKMKEAAQAAEAALERTTKAREKFARQQQEPAARIAADLQRMGAYSPENFERAIYTMYVAMEEGVAKAKAAALAAPAMLAGLKSWQIARLAVVGAKPETPEQAREMFAKLQAEQKTRIEVGAAAEAAKKTPEGRAAIAEAAVFWREKKKQPRLMEKIQQTTHDAIILAQAAQIGLVEEEAGIERVDALLREHAKLKDEYEGILSHLPVPTTEAPGTWTHPAVAISIKERLQALQPLVDLSEDLKAAGIHDVTGEVQDAVGPEWEPPLQPSGFSPETRQVIVNINNNQTTVNQGMVLTQDANWLRIEPDPIDMEQGF